MPPPRAQIARFAVVGSLSVLAVTACSSPGNLTPTTAASQWPFACCSSGDIEPVRYPGQTLELHWMTTSSDPSATSGLTTVRLEASLSGPFASVAELKAADGPATVVAPVLDATTTPGSAPVSIIRIPQDAPVGLYDLTTTVSHNGARLSGSHVIKVKAN